MVGGREEAVRRTAWRPIARGCDCSVRTLDRASERPGEILPARAEVDGIPMVRVPFRGADRPRLSPACPRHPGDSDIVLLHGIDFAFDVPAATRPIRRKPPVASTHGGLFQTAFAARAMKVYLDTVTRTSARAHRGIRAVSRNDAETVARIVPHARLLPIGNGVDATRFEGLASGTTERAPIYFGRLPHARAVLPLLDPLARPRAFDPDWRLAICGHP